MSSYSRRDLVKAASLVPFSAVRGTAANNAVKVGLIGAGGRGTFDAGFVAKRSQRPPGCSLRHFR